MKYNFKALPTDPWEDVALPEEAEPDDMFASDNLTIGSVDSEVAMDILAMGDNREDAYNDPLAASIHKAGPMFTTMNNQPQTIQEVELPDDANQDGKLLYVKEADDESEYPYADDPSMQMGDQPDLDGGFDEYDDFSMDDEGLDDIDEMEMIEQGQDDLFAADVVTRGDETDPNAPILTRGDSMAL